MYLKTNKRGIAVLLLFSMLLSLVFPVYAAAEEVGGEMTVPFTCWIGSGDEKIQGVRSDEDGKYYLTVPAGTVAADVTVNYAGGAMGEGSVPGAFAEGMEKTLTAENGESYTVVLKVEEASAPETPFACWIGTGDEKIQGVLSGEDGKYYLTVPAGTVAADVTVNYAGGAMGEGSVPGAFAEGMEKTLTAENGESHTVVLKVEEASAPETPFACWIGTGDEKIQGVLSDEDGKYYLTVPAGTVAADVTVNYAGGTMGEGSVSGAFALGREKVLSAENGDTYTIVLKYEITDTREFSCFTYDEKGNQINAYWSDKDSVWYLFVPSTVSVPDMTLSYTGPVCEVSAGVLTAGTSTVTGAFSRSGDVLTLKDTNGRAYSVQVLQSGLPSVHIVLNGKTLDDVHADKDTKHKNNTVYIMDPSGTYDLEVENSVEVKGRGNTTWRLFDKKGYQIKFDSKTSVLGMGKAKKWVLLANAGDDSMMRTTLTYRMADKLDMGFVPAMEYADLWVNGEYLGTYMVGDKVEPGSSRVDLKNDMGVLFEQDEAYYAEEDYWFFSEYLQRHFVMKEIVEEEDAYIEAAMTDFEESVDRLAKYLYFTPSSEATLEDLSAIIDVDSFVKYYLVSEYVQNKEAVVSSFYWHKDGPEDVIHMGPLWDYDTCMGNDAAYDVESYSHNYLLFYYLLAIPEFRERTEQLKEQYWTYLTAMDEDADVIASKIQDSAAMNYLRWDVLGKPSNKDGSCFAETFEKAVENVKSWLKARESSFTVRTEPVVYTSISADNVEMEIYFDDDNVNSSVKFAVWGDPNKQNDLKWYQAERDENGLMRASVALANHNETGTYQIHAYSGSKYIGRGMSYVEKIAEPEIKAWVNADCTSMQIKISRIGDWSKVLVPVWSLENNQDDLVWYTATKNSDGTYSLTVDLREHGSAGDYIIHVYAETPESDLIAATSCFVEKAVKPYIKATVNADCTEMEIKLTDIGDWSKVLVPVWSVENNQDDLVWYTAAKNADGTYSLTVDLRDHGSAGNYIIHVYGNTPNSEMIAAASCYVEKAAVPYIIATVNEDCTEMEIKLTDIGDWSKVLVPVWSVENGQDDLVWYTATKNSDGTYGLTVDLREHGSAGDYIIHVYAETPESERLAASSCYVKKAVAPYIKATVNADCTKMEIKLTGIGNWSKVLVPVWSVESSQDDLVWYTATKNSDDTYSLTVDLRDHNSAGNYIIHVYGDTPDSEMIAASSCYVAKAAASYIQATVNKDCTELDITLNGIGDWNKVLVPVWSVENGQDDLVWYTATRNSDDSYSLTVDLRDHGSAGDYIIHVYGDTAKSERIVAASCFVEKAVDPYIKTTVNADCTEMEIKLTGIGDWDKVLVPVWSVENSQDDLVWYTATKNSDGTYSLTVDLRDHNSAGDYIIHVYADSPASERLLASSCYVEKAAA